VQVMEVRKRVLGAEHPDTLASMHNLAVTFSDQGRWTEAEALQVQVMEVKKRVLGTEHPGTLTSMYNLAWTRKGRGRDAEARKLMEQCVAAQTRILGANHPSTVNSCAVLHEWHTEQLEIASADKDLGVS
jgi:hypothetical protein